MTTKITAAVLSALASGLVFAAADAPVPPPYAGDVAVKAEAPATQTRPGPKAAESNPLVPTKEEMRKAREDAEAGRVQPKSSRETKIEAVRDPNNHVTEYVVTPGSTHIPYTMENRSDRPIDTGPGGNSKNTLGTPKFIKFGW